MAGSFLGGTLATSLALTSTYANARSAPVRVAGLVTLNAVFDWTRVAVTRGESEKQQLDGKEKDVDGTDLLTRRVRIEEGWEAETLQVLKTHLFTNPQGAFDNFASPVLFFHTPAFVVPAKWPGVESSSEENRYSTSISPEDDITSEFIEEDVAGDGERGEAEIIGTAIPSQARPPRTSKQTAKKVMTDNTPEIARISYLKFPPNATQTSSNSYSRYADSQPVQPQLKIPRSLLLYSSTEAPLNNVQSLSKSRKSKRKKITDGEEVVDTPEKQAKEMARLMRRSVVMVECKERTMWDEGFDPHEVAGDRVKVLEMGGEEGEGEDGRGFEERVGDWVEECLG